MKVYVLETGVYEGRGIHGIYESAEAAMAAWHPVDSRPPRTRTREMVTDLATGRLVRTVTRTERRHTYTWSRTDWGWRFDADWEHAGDITEYEVET